MEKTLSDLLAGLLARWIETGPLFEEEGSPFRPLTDALRRVPQRPRIIRVSEAAFAAAAASSSAEATGRLGICLVAPKGPQELLTSAFLEAILNRRPVLCLAPASARLPLEPGCTLSEARTGAAVSCLHSAAAGALWTRGVAIVRIPTETLARQAAVSDLRDMDRALRSATAHAEDETRIDEESLGSAAAALNLGGRIAIVAGRGARRAGAEIETAAEILGAPVLKTLLGKAALPDDSPYVGGGVGRYGTQAGRDALERAERILLVGTSIPYRDLLVASRPRQVVRIDRDPRRVDARDPSETVVVGDAAAVLRALIPRLMRNEERSSLEAARTHVEEQRHNLDLQASRPGWPPDARTLAWRLGRMLPEDAIIAVDAGPVATTWVRSFPAKRGQVYAIAGNLLSSAHCLPCAVAAQAAHPDRPCIALLGPLGVQALRREFPFCVGNGLPIKFLVLSEERSNTGSAISDAPLRWEGAELTEFARSRGGGGFPLMPPEDPEEVLGAALAHPGPSILEVAWTGRGPEGPGEGRNVDRSAPRDSSGSPHDLD